MLTLQLVEFGLILSASFLLCCCITPLARDLAMRWGLVDRPDARRKLHGRVIPVAGGIVVLLSTCVVVLASGLPYEGLRGEFYPFLGLFLASLALCGLGVIDDLKCLRGRHKLLGQITAGVVVVSFGVRIDCLDLFGWPFHLGPLAIPFTLLWLLGAINSLNLIDGMDGMLGCVGLIITLALGVMALMTHHWAWACVAAALSGSLLGFLRYNFPPASIFMGDAGSMVTGLVAGVLGIQCSLKAPAAVALMAPTTYALMAPMVVLTIPFLDTLAALLRRLLTGRSIYATDRGHLHHCLLRQGYSARGVLACASFFSVVAAAGGVASLALKNELIALCTILTVAAVLIVTGLFGYAEFLLVKNRLGRMVRSLLQTRAAGKSHQIEVHLHGTYGWKGLQQGVASKAFALNLQTIRLDVSDPARHEEYHAQWDRFEEEVEDSLWRVEIPVTIEGRDVGRMLVSGYVDQEPVWTKVATIIQLIEEFQHTVAPHHRFDPPLPNGVSHPANSRPLLGKSSDVDTIVVPAGRDATDNHNGIVSDSL